MDLKYYLKTYKPAVLNLGCGKTCPDEHYGMDVEDFVGVDQVCDLTEGIPVKDNLFDKVFAKDVLEHIPQGKPCVKLMEEIYRVLKPGGILDLEVPSTDGGGVGAFGHPYHVSWWNKTAIEYYLDDSFTGGWRASIGVECYFKPLLLYTYYNERGMTYVKAELQKKD